MKGFVEAWILEANPLFASALERYYSIENWTPKKGRPVDLYKWQSAEQRRHFPQPVFLLTSEGYRNALGNAIASNDWRFVQKVATGLKNLENSRKKSFFGDLRFVFEAYRFLRLKDASEMYYGTGTTTERLPGEPPEEPVKGRIKELTVTIKVFSGSAFFAKLPSYLWGEQNDAPILTAAETKRLENRKFAAEKEMENRWTDLFKNAGLNSLKDARGRKPGQKNQRIRGAKN
jgi:hypothetical protein